MEQLTKNQAVATSQEAVQNQNEPQLRDENAHNDKSVHGVLNPTYQAGLRRDAVQADSEAEREKREEVEAGKRYCSGRLGGAARDDRSAHRQALFDNTDYRSDLAELSSASSTRSCARSSTAVCSTRIRTRATCSSRTTARSCSSTSAPSGGWGRTSRRPSSRPWRRRRPATRRCCARPSRR